MKVDPHDPFSERAKIVARARLSVLGADFEIDSTDSRLLELAIDAFGGLPKHGLDQKLCRLKVRLVLNDCRKSWPKNEKPPQPALNSGNGLLCATVDAGNFAIVDVAMSRALVCASQSMLRYPYYARYELIEFAILTLASRAQSLVPLHAACVGNKRSGVLLMGSSGTGKSTLSLAAFAGGMKLLSEDSAFIEPSNLLVTGTPNFLHVERETLDFLKSVALKKEIRHSPVIQRRSGTRKLELDVRKFGRKIAQSPLNLVAIAFLTRRSAGKQSVLKRIDHKACLSRLRREQPFALGMSNWREFERRIVDIPAYELRRANHPDISIQELRSLLD